MTIVLAILATYYISNVLVYSDGAWGFLYKTRHNKYIDNFGLMNCIMCVSFWVALIISVFLFKDNWLLYTLAISGAVTAVDKYIYS